MTKQIERDAGGWPAIILYISVASALSGAFAYLATSPAQPVVVAAAKTIVHHAVPQTVPPPPVVTDTPPTPPVQVANPFDASEVFEFPSGTSETEAKQAVADMLLQRARDRQDAWSKQRRRTASLVVPVT